MKEQLERKYNLFTATCMVVGIVIGSGIFFKAQTILQKTGGNMPLGIIAWVIGGLIMMACLLTFSFMAQKIEHVNGIVDYAEALVGKRYGYYMGWFVSIIYFPSMTAALAWLSARYTLVFITSVNPNFPLLIPAAEGGCIIGPECIALTLFYLCAGFTMNTLSPKLAGKFQTSTTIIKMIPLALMAVVGVIYGLMNGNLANNMTTTAIVETVSANPLFAAVCSTAFAYEGWIIATSINSEIQDSKRNLPRALTIGGIIIMITYVAYYIGVSGGATNQQLIDVGPVLAYTNIFGGVLGNILNLFIAISCMGTLNGLILGTSRGIYSLAVRDKGISPKTYSQVDKVTNMPHNSAVLALTIIAAWFVYFYLSNLACTWSGPFVFDCTELPIITIYSMYIPIFIKWIKDQKDENIIRRFILPICAIMGSLFMVYACYLAHGIGCLWYLIVFAVIMFIGHCYY